MLDPAALRESVKTTLLEISKQQRALGEGLQGVAIAKAGTPNLTIQYLLESAEYIAEKAKQCNE